MKGKVLVILASAALFSCKQGEESASFVYPESHKVDTVDNYHGVQVADPYRWLENDTSAETADWVRRQNEFTFSYLERIPFRAAIRGRLEELVNYERYSAPITASEYILYYYNNGLQNQDVIYIKKGEDGEAEVFLDPNEFDAEGTTTMRLSGMSKDETKVVVSISKAGSDWREFVVYDIAERKSMGDTLRWVKFSGASWWSDGFFYSRYPEPREGEDYSAYNAFHSVYYHQMGTPQAEDVLIYEDKENPGRYHGVDVSEDEQFLILYVSEGTDGNELHFAPLGKEGDFQPLITGFKNNSAFVDHHEGRFLVATDIDAPNYRLVSIDPQSPEKENWIDIIPEEQVTLNYVTTGGGYLFANYLKKATTRVNRFDYSGKVVEEVELPGVGSAGGFGGEREDSVLYFSYSSFTEPGTIYKYDVKSNSSEVYFRPELAFDPDQFESSQVVYNSLDGTPVTMFLVHKKGLELNGENPLLLYGYGGFNISLTPRFSSSIIPWLEAGGIYAMPNLRGGGEYGEEWHKAGMLKKKQNVFDDFIAAAQYLIDEKYTSSEKLVISGRSNGGLLVGAVMTQRPELFKVALPGVGVLDMLRYHKFTVGHGWVPEYGSSDTTLHFGNLYGYSPLHNVKEGKAYPATMIYTADHDDRVVPAHSFKFAATLQEKQGGDLPVLIRIETDAGHGSGKPISKQLDEEADKLAFSFYHTGLKPAADN